MSPDKLRGQLAYTQNGALWVVDPNTRQTHLLVAHDVTRLVPQREPHVSYRAQGFAFSPDLKSVVVNVSKSPATEAPDDYNRMDGPFPGTELFVFPLDGRSGRRVTSDNWQPKNNVRWSPDGKHLAYTRTSASVPDTKSAVASEVRVVDANFNRSDDHAVAGSLTQEPFASNPFWSRDSARLLFSALGTSRRQIEPNTQTQNLTVALNGSSPRPFDGDWSYFTLPQVARGAGTRVETYFWPRDQKTTIKVFKARENGALSARVNPAPESSTHIFALIPPKSEEPVATFLGENYNFVIEGAVLINPAGSHIAFEARRSGFAIDSQGYFQPLGLRKSIYLVWGGAGNEEQVRLLVTNAHPLEWL